MLLVVPFVEGFLIGLWAMLDGDCEISFTLHCPVCLSMWFDLAMAASMLEISSAS